MLSCVFVYYNEQGRYDVVCPMMSAWDLHKAWPEADLKVKLLKSFLNMSYLLSLFLLVGNATHGLQIVGDCGHSANEPGIAAELVVANEKMKAFLG